MKRKLFWIGFLVAWLVLLGRIFPGPIDEFIVLVLSVIKIMRG